MMKNQKGITLIALVITIIVLLILAGVSIAMLTGNNGVLTQANKAKMSQIEGQVAEEIRLAVQAAKMHAEQKAVASPTEGYLAESQIGTTSTSDTPVTGETDKIITVLRQDLKTTKGYTKIEAGTGKVTITYSTDAYKAATNYTSSKIVAEVTISGNTFSITSMKATRAADTEVNI